MKPTVGGEQGGEGILRWELSKSSTCCKHLNFLELEVTMDSLYQAAHLDPPPQSHRAKLLSCPLASYFFWAKWEKNSALELDLSLNPPLLSFATLDK